MAAVATVVAPGVPNPQMSPNSQGTSTTPGGAPGVTKRYRAAPAKTFQCRGYGDCRMVFSRSEHLARHVRKHTGERPFSCHCGKQFSRLDNLRQHAQTVHADKQDLNEKMMRELTALHTSMASSNKGGGRGKRAQQQQQQQQVMSAAIGGQQPQSAAAAAAGSSQQHTMMNVANNGANGANGQIMTVKEEEMQHPLPSNYGLGSSRLHTLSQLQLSVKVPARQQLPPTPPITPPTTIPFVTNPASPFVSPQPRHNNNNSNSNNINRAAAASPFSPPPHPTLSSHSTSQQLAAAAVAAAAAGHPLQVVPTHMLGPSRPSLPLSPNPSPHPNNNHPLQTAPHYFQYPHQVQEDSDPRPPLVPGQLPPHTSPTDLLSVEGLDWSLSQNYPFTTTTNSPLDGWAPQQGRRGSMSPAAAAELETARHRPLQADHPTTHHFPSTHPHSPNHRPGGVGNDLTQDQTDSTNHRHHQLNGNRPQEPGQQQAQTSTSTVATPDLSLAGSPSWSSAMTTPHHHPHQLHQGPFYHYHPQQQPHVQTPHPGSQSGPSASHPQPPPPQPPHTPQQAHSVPTTPQEEEYMQRLAVMSQHQQQQQSRLFQLQDPQQHLHYPQRHAQEDMHHHHPHHRMQQQIPHHHVQIKYESPGLLPSQLPLLPE